MKFSIDFILKLVYLYSYQNNNGVMDMSKHLFNHSTSDIDELINKLDNITAGAGAFLMAFLIASLIFQYFIR